MILVTITLVPCTGAPPKEIGRMYIANDGTGTVERGDYVAAVCRRGTTAIPAGLGTGPKATRAAKVLTDGALELGPRLGEIKDYPRLAYNVWRLITRALLACFPEENRRARSSRT